MSAQKNSELSSFASQRVCVCAPSGPGLVGPPRAFKAWPSRYFGKILCGLWGYRTLDRFRVKEALSRAISYLALLVPLS